MFEEIEKEKGARVPDRMRSVANPMWRSSWPRGPMLDRMLAQSPVTRSRESVARLVDRTLEASHDRMCTGCVRSQVTYSDVAFVSKRSEDRTPGASG